MKCTGKIATTKDNSIRKCGTEMEEVGGWKSVGVTTEKYTVADYPVALYQCPSCMKIKLA